VAALLPQGAHGGEVLDESRLSTDPTPAFVIASATDLPAATPATGENRRERVVLVGSGSGLGRALLRASAMLAVAVAAQPAQPSPRQKATSLFARVPHEPAPGMNRQDLKRLQRQHEQAARKGGRYRPR